MAGGEKEKERGKIGGKKEGIVENRGKRGKERGEKGGGRGKRGTGRGRRRRKERKKEWEWEANRVELVQRKRKERKNEMKKEQGVKKEWEKMDRSI